LVSADRTSADAEITEIKHLLPEDRVWDGGVCEEPEVVKVLCAWQRLIPTEGHLLVLHDAL
jgi:hypothetical protein